MPTELVWDGKYKDGKKVSPLRISLPFQDVETVNESAQERQKMLDLFSSGRPTDWRNRLIWGDKRYVLPSLLDEFAGKVNLVYIDPPFDTGADFSFDASVADDDLTFTKQPSIIERKAYRDTWGRGLDSYLQWFYETVCYLKELLHKDGTLYVHIGQNMSHFVRAVLDDVFPGQFVNQIVWKRQTAHSDIGQGAKHMGRLHDVLLLYGNSETITWNMQYQAYDEEYATNFDKYVEPGTGRRYRLSDITGPGGASKGNPHYEFLGVTRYWRYSQKRMQELYNQGRIIQTKPGVVPAYKRYLDEMPGRPLQDIWDDVRTVQSQAVERTGYPTQKPEALLERVIKLSSNQDDLVLANSTVTKAVV